MSINSFRKPCNTIFKIFKQMNRKFKFTQVTGVSLNCPKGNKYSTQDNEEKKSHNKSHNMRRREM